MYYTPYSHTIITMEGFTDFKVNICEKCGKWVKFYANVSMLSDV